MDGFKIAGSPDLSGLHPGNDTIKDYLSLFINSFFGIFRYRFSDGAFLLIHQDALNIPRIAAVAAGSLYHRSTKDLFTGKATRSCGKGPDFISNIKTKDLCLCNKLIQTPVTK